MRNKNNTAKSKARVEIETAITEQWNLLLEDYPRNRKKVLEWFDSIIENFQDKAHIQRYFQEIKTAFLKSKKEINNEKK